MATKKSSHKPAAKKKSATKKPVAYVEFTDSKSATKKPAKKPVAYVEFTDTTSTKKGSKKAVAYVEYKKPPKKK